MNEEWLEFLFAGPIIRKSISFKQMLCENWTKLKLILSAALQSRTALWYRKGNKFDSLKNVHPCLEFFEFYMCVCLAELWYLLKTDLFCSLIFSLWSNVQSCFVRSHLKYLNVNTRQAFSRPSQMGWGSFSALQILLKVKIPAVTSAVQPQVHSVLFRTVYKGLAFLGCGGLGLSYWPCDFFSFLGGEPAIWALWISRRSL